MRKPLLFLSVSLIPVSAIAGVPQLKDIASSDFKTYIEQCVQKGIISGYTDKTFRPNNSVSYVEALKIIINAGPKKSSLANYPGDTNWSTQFKNLYTAEDATSLISFRDNDPITRDFAVYLMLRQLGINPTEADITKMSVSFSDIQNSTPLAPYIVFAKYAGISGGFKDGTFGPKKQVSRGELTKMAYKTLLEDRDTIVSKYRELGKVPTTNQTNAPQSTLEKIGATTNNQNNTPLLPVAKTNTEEKVVINTLSNFNELSAVKKLVKQVVQIEPTKIYEALSDSSRINAGTTSDGKVGFMSSMNFGEYSLYTDFSKMHFLSKKEGALSQNEISKKMIQMINDFRKENGLSPVVDNSILQITAQLYATEMHQKNHYDHISPDGLSPSDRAKKNGYTVSLFAENIAKGQNSVEEVMTAWKNSPGHRANMLIPTIKDVGIGYYGGYWVQNFGETASSTPVLNPSTTDQGSTPTMSVRVEITSMNGEEKYLNSLQKDASTYTRNVAGNTTYTIDELKQKVKRFVSSKEHCYYYFAFNDGGQTNAIYPFGRKYLKLGAGNTSVSIPNSIILSEQALIYDQDKREYLLSTVGYYEYSTTQIGELVRKYQIQVYSTAQENLQKWLSNNTGKFIDIADLRDKANKEFGDISPEVMIVLPRMIEQGFPFQFRGPIVANDSSLVTTSVYFTKVTNNGGVFYHFSYEKDASTYRILLSDADQRTLISKGVEYTPNTYLDTNNQKFYEVRNVKLRISNITKDTGAPADTPTMKWYLANAELVQ